MRQSWALAGLLLAVATTTPACVPAKDSNDPSRVRAVPPADVPDDRFASALVEVLQDGSRTESRHKLMLGVVRRQLVHAGQRYERGANDRATQSVMGGLYLMRPGEHSTLLLDADAAHAIDGAIDKLSARGDIGRARVLMTLRASTMSVKERKDIDAHIAALDQFRLETLTGKPMERAGDAERASASMALLFPEHLDAAMRDIDAWIGLGIQGNLAFQQTGKRPSPEEAIEIARSLSSGAATVVALMLRYADVQGAMDRVVSTNVRRVMEPQFFAQLKEVERKNDLPSWRNLLDALADDVGDRVGGEIGIDPDLYAAARLTILVEAYRNDPRHLETCLDLSRSLSEFGMSEAVPLILDGALGQAAREPQVAQAIRAVARAIIADASVNDVAAAARTIAAAEGFLDHAKRALGDRGGAAVAELRHNMATILLKGGYLKDADKLLGLALADAPRAQGHLLLAKVKRQTNAQSEALEAVGKIVALPNVDALDLADARLLEFEILRDRGQARDAEAALAKALASATSAVSERKAGPSRARAFVTLGRVLAAYGDKTGSRLALSRAMDSATSDRGILGSTMLQAASVGLALGDREGVRAALRKGFDAGVPNDDLVYAALWLMLADQQAGARTDPSVVEILDANAPQPTWLGRLATWGRGRLSDERLAQSAVSEASRVEAAFYVAMAKRARGGPSDDALRTVASSPVLQLREVQIARDILAPRSDYGVPKDFKMP